MGEAKRRANAPVSVVYHHTSTLRTNLIWMSGVIELEGRSQGALHPILGEVHTDVAVRRACVDFPPLAWFTSEIRVPQVLLNSEIILQSNEGGAPHLASDMLEPDAHRLMQRALALHRVALGFPIEGTGITRWSDHPGYHTDEGRELNETAHDAGDDPDRWWVSDKPVDVLTATEVWLAGSVFQPKLKCRPEYLRDVHQMVRICRELPGTVIPPSWINNPQVQEMAERWKAGA